MIDALSVGAFGAAGGSAVTIMDEVGACVDRHLG